MWTSVLLLSALLAYAAWRATMMFRAKRHAYAIALVFLMAIVLYELILLFLRGPSAAPGVLP